MPLGGYGGAGRTARMRS